MVFCYIRITFLQRNTDYNDYYPFGILVPNRHGSSNSYRYGFQGQEKDDELKGEGNTLNYTFRMHDPRVGRFFARDPLFRKYPYNSPYAFSENRVIDAIELEGLEAVNVGKENPYLIIIVTGRAGGAIRPRQNSELEQLRADGPVPGARYRTGAARHRPR